MTFDASRLPDALSFFDAEGIDLQGRGTWRTGPCVFHGGSDSLRVNVKTGRWVCMAGCGARGDLIAYHQAVHGGDFVDTCKALGAWVEDGRPVPRQRRIPFSARDALEVAAFEIHLAAVAAGNLATGIELDRQDRERLSLTASRLHTIFLWTHHEHTF